MRFKLAAAQAALLPSLSLVLTLAMLSTVPALAHVTPNVELLKKGDFVQQSLPGASQYLEKKLAIGGSDLAAIKKGTGWTPSEEDVRIYVGRDRQGALIGTVVFLWIPSEHGPVGVGVAFDPAGAILRAEVTDVGSEPLAWVRPLLASNGMSAFAGLPLATPPDSAKLSPAATGRMSRYYAEVIADGVKRAQAIERVARETDRR
ncbi:MAG TPA: hypothetical protein VIE43_15885 [Thermoanaerobaculia bacterium]|nr:hypothetical protein [Thermoanaerobaculia bacterium]